MVGPQAAEAVVGGGEFTDLVAYAMSRPRRGDLRQIVALPTRLV